MYANFAVCDFFSGQVIITLTKRVLYAVLNEVYIAVCSPVADNPFETAHYLDRARAYVLVKYFAAL